MYFKYCRHSWQRATAARGLRHEWLGSTQNIEGAYSTERNRGCPANTKGAKAILGARCWSSSSWGSIRTPGVGWKWTEEEWLQTWLVYSGRDSRLYDFGWPIRFFHTISKPASECLSLSKIARSCTLRLVASAVTAVGGALGQSPKGISSGMPDTALSFSLLKCTTLLTVFLLKIKHLISSVLLFSL